MMLSVLLQLKATLLILLDSEKRNTLTCGTIDDMYIVEKKKLAFQKRETQRN